ncbi:ATP-dependent DNA helicase 2 subunit ku80 [Thecamonas trahens ATCC 50062]|uniref:ATP-dependent DNA helicase 2 subunit ku80 n=1 Tax=Thecamonas trahens ATCC 50062 TaxID=461836 RepID=A0A0L0DL07_THETB|nr:ATP-dependent DNA helicase 2 subunit ku80 [Thecamonas trahens ATCC 50062]KNC52940.1 ATP-dependent DNA helicase 2 subunit ku80 [Thecamonas trahens ATCC 50062]|eukprot:XP_013754835.1 ATP-dependent DNA helicase 2 subunit ku80 [Thecamonas trahens ATCC 50062]
MSKEACVVVLDVSAGMATVGTNGHSHLSSAKTLIDLFLKAKLMHRKNDVVGIVEVGRTGGGGSGGGHPALSYFSDVTLRTDVSKPTVDLLLAVPHISVAQSKGDALHGVLVALDLIDGFCGKRKWAKRVMLITNGLSSLDPSNLPTLAMRFEEVGASLSLIGIGFDEFDDDEMAVPGFEARQAARTDKPPLLLANEALYRDVCASVDATFVNLKSALAHMSAFRSKDTLQRPSYTGTLDVGPGMAIGVYGYTKTMRVTLPSATKRSLEAGADSQGKVEMQTSYRRSDDDLTELEKDKICKGFRLGQSIVPFSAIDESVLKYCAPKALKVLGFAPAKQVFRHQYMSNITCLVPTPNSPESATALHSLIMALYETDRIMLVRFVARNNSAPRLGFCWPSVEEDGLCLYYSHLPFMDDVRNYDFASLSLIQGNVPNKAQLDAAEALIDSLDLMTAQVDEDGEAVEALKPENTYNPVMQYFYQVVQHRALHPDDTALPPVDPIISAYMQPDANLFAAAAPAMAAFKELFPLVPAEKTKKRRARFWAVDGDVGVGGSDVAGPSSTVPGATSGASSAAASSALLTGDGTLAKRPRVTGAADVSVDSILAQAVSQITSVNPVADFEAMCARRDEDLVNTAIAQLAAMIESLVDTSFRAAYYPKALECLVALRAMSILQEEPGAFNALLPKLRAKYATGRKAEWWASVVDARVTLISSDECAEATVSAADAAAFLAGDSDEVPAPAPEAPADDGDATTATTRTSLAC